MIDHRANLPIHANNKFFNEAFKKKYIQFSWKKNSKEITNTILYFAKKNPSENFIFKAKPNTVQEEIKLAKNKNLKNVKIYESGNSLELIYNAKIIIAFNTSGILEGMINRKKIIVPLFNMNKYNKDFMSIYNKNIVEHPKNKKQLIESLKKVLKQKNNLYSKKQEKYLNKLIKFNLGNSDGGSSRRMRLFFRKELLI